MDNGDWEELAAYLDSKRFRADHQIALWAAREAMAPARGEEILMELSRFMALVGGGWTEAGREEYLSVLMSELSSFPAALALDAVKRARRYVRSSGAFLPWVCEDILPKMKTLEEQLLRLEVIEGKLLERDKVRAA